MHIFFKTNKGDTEVYFDKFKRTFYKPVIKAPNKTVTLPLLLEVSDIKMTLKKLLDVKKIKGIDHIYDYDLLTNIVAGASKISMKASDGD